MGYLYGLVVIGVLFTTLHYFTELRNKQKIAISVVAGLLVLSAYLYNLSSQGEQEQILLSLQAFENNQTLTCKNGKKVNSMNYSLSVGTYTFIGKENTPYNSDMISVRSCR